MSFAHIRRPKWLYKCKFYLNKVKGDSAFSLKTKSPSGATARGIPPKKWSHFFTKNFIANALSTS
jgi:hypothetical protein